MNNKYRSILIAFACLVLFYIFTWQIVDNLLFKIELYQIIIMDVILAFFRRLFIFITRKTSESN